MSPTSMLAPAERPRPSMRGVHGAGLLAVVAFEAQAKGWTAKTIGEQKEHEITTVT